MTQLLSLQFGLLGILTIVILFVYGFIMGQLYEINYCFEINFRWCIYHGLVTALLEYDEYDLCILCQDETKSNDSIQIPSPQGS